LRADGPAARPVRGAGRAHRPAAGHDHARLGPPAAPARVGAGQRGTDPDRGHAAPRVRRVAGRPGGPVGAAPADPHPGPYLGHPVVQKSRNVQKVEKVTGAVMMCPAPPAVPEVPFTAAINPLTRAVQEHSRDWVYRFGLVRGRAAVRRVTRMRLGYLAGRTHPRAPFDRLAVASDWLSWRFLLDGQVEELPPGLLTGASSGAAGRELPDRMADVLQPGQPSADTPVSRALANLWRRTARLASARWQERFAADLSDHLRRLREEMAGT